MKRRDIALHLVLTVGAIVIVLAVMVGAMPRMRPDTINLNLHLDGKSLRSVPVKLIVDSRGSPSCQSAGLQGLTNLRGSHVWQRHLRELPWQTFQPQVDVVAVCALLGGEQRLLWSRSHIGWKEMLNLSCNAGSDSANVCVAKEDLTMGQTFNIAVLAMLIALLVRVFWNRGSSGSARAVFIALASIFAACLVYAIPVSMDLQRFLSALMVGGLAGIHIGLGRLFRESSETSGAPETGISGDFGS